MLLLGLICVSYPEVVTGRATFFHRDFALFGYPFAEYHREFFWRGELPLWSPLNYAGLPYLAQWNTLTLYPLSILYLVLPLSFGLGFFCLSHLFLAGLGMYALAYRWTKSEFAAAVAGLTFAFSALTLNSLMWPNNLAAMGWLPWVILSAERAWNQGRRHILIAAGAGTMQMLTGAPEVILFTWLMVAVLLVREIAAQIPWPAGATSFPDPHTVVLHDSSPPAQTGVRRAPALKGGRWFACVLLIAGLSAAQLLPFFDLLEHSQRGGGFSESDCALPWWGWANFLVPLFRMVPTSLGPYGQPWQYWIPSYYLGIGVTVLALLGAWVRPERRRPRFVLALLAAVGLLLALGANGGLYSLACAVFPPLKLMRFPVKFVLLPACTVPLLAACFVAELERTPTANWDRVWRRVTVAFVCTVVGVAVIVGLAYARPMERISAATAAASGISRIAFLTAILGGLLLTMRTPARRLKSLLQIGVLCLLWLDIMTMGPRPNPTVPRWVYEPRLLQRHGDLQPFPQPGAARVMLSKEAEIRLANSTLSNAVEQVVFTRLGLQGNANLPEGVAVVGGLYSLYLREIGEVLGVLYAAPEPPAGLLDFLAVSHLNLPGKITERSFRPTHLPWVTAGQSPIFTNAAATLGALAAPDFDPRRSVFLPVDAAHAVTVTNHSAPQIHRRTFAAQRIEVDLDARAPALLVIAQAFHHNWQATVDGQRVPLLRANHAFQALQVPAGRHVVVVEYRDRAFRFGAGISLATLCTGAALWWRGRKAPAPIPPS